MGGVDRKGGREVYRSGPVILNHSLPFPNTEMSFSFDGRAVPLAGGTIQRSITGHTHTPFSHLSFFFSSVFFMKKLRAWRRKEKERETLILPLQSWCRDGHGLLPRKAKKKVGRSILLWLCHGSCAVFLFASKKGGRAVRWWRNFKARFLYKNIFFLHYLTPHMSCNVIRARLLDFFCRQIIFIGAVDWKIPQILPNISTVGLKPLVNRWQKNIARIFCCQFSSHIRAQHISWFTYTNVWGPPFPFAVATVPCSYQRTKQPRPLLLPLSLPPPTAALEVAGIPLSYTHRIVRSSAPVSPLIVRGNKKVVGISYQKWVPSLR